jgi:hypothetical protein
MSYLHGSPFVVEVCAVSSFSSLPVDVVWCTWFDLIELGWDEWGVCSLSFSSLPYTITVNMISFYLSRVESSWALI